MKKNILIISIYYPPKQSIASNRIYAFAKYLDKNSFNIYVHSIDENKEFNNSLEGVVVSRVKNNSLFKPFTFEKRSNVILHYLKVIYNLILKRFTENIYQKWIDNSFELLKKRVEKENIDIIISSFAPDASHILALKLKKEFPHIKWIADMRDEMSRSPYIDNKTKNRYEKLEEEIFKYSDAITSVSKPILDEFRQSAKYKKIIFKEIRNGYDFDTELNYSRNRVFIISYVGNFYGDINPKKFLEALSNIKYNIELKVRFIGVKSHFDIPYNLRDTIFIIPQLSHQEAVKEMKKSDALLLIHPSNGRKGVFTGKLFEYLGVLRPILALIDEDDVAAELIKEANAGYITDNSNIRKIEEYILKIYKEWESGYKREYNLEIIKKHHRREQTKRLERVIEKVLSE